MSVSHSIALKLEVERVDLLYRQNIAGVIALVVYSWAYVYASQGIIDQDILYGWVGILMASAVLRVGATLRWRKIKQEIHSLAEIKKWLIFNQGMLFVSGAGWGVVGWMFTSSTSSAHQIVTALTVVFMVAGALVCHSASLVSMFAVVFPAMIPWTLAMLISPDPMHRFLGILAGLYTVLGTKVGITLNSYILSSLRLNVENTQLTSELQQEIVVKDQAEEALRVALTSSDAMSWSWEVEKDIFTCSGDLRQSLGLDAENFKGSLDEFIQFVYKDDQEKLRTRFLKLALKGGELDTDPRVDWPNGTVHDLVFRGKAERSPDGKTTHLAGIAWDATAKKSQERLQQEKNIHKAANKAKSVFLANASHEIRTPLAAINGFVETMLQQEGLAPDLKRDLQSVERNGKYLTALVNDFLDLAKIETGRFYMQKGAITPRREIDDAIELVKTSIEEKGLKLSVNYESPLPESIESDSMRFRQVLVNLLTNAAKFTNQGTITVRVAHQALESDSQLVIRVSDTGIGMDKRIQSQLFEPFMRGQNADVQRVSGSGLGLALSKHLANLLGGDLRLVESAQGIGSEFEFTVNTGPIEGLHFPAKQAERLLPNQLDGRQILVVDDAEDLRIFMSRYLEKQGAKVETCVNGLEAVTKAVSRNFDMVLMDIKMPVMDGNIATSILRRNGFTKPIVAVTAHASAEDRQRCLDAGCTDYLSKPVEGPHLIQAIVTILSKDMQGSIRA